MLFADVYIHYYHMPFGGTRTLVIGGSISYLKPELEPVFRRMLADVFNAYYLMPFGGTRTQQRRIHILPDKPEHGPVFRRLPQGACPQVCVVPYLQSMHTRHN